MTSLAYVRLWSLAADLARLNPGSPTVAQRAVARKLRRASRTQL